MLGRLVIDNVRPRTPTGGYPAKAAVGERVEVSADVLHGGHDLLAARVCWRLAGSDRWCVAPANDRGNDAWAGFIEPAEVGMHEVMVEAWVDHYGTWAHDVSIKRDAGVDVTVELEEGALIIEARRQAVKPEAAGPLDTAVSGLRDENRSVEERLAAGLDPAVAEALAGVPDRWDRALSAVQKLWVDRSRARSGAWYELFPRSEGGFEGARRRLPAIAEMGFDVVYLAPIHPIGDTDRKGPNNTLEGDGHPGSPWAIGSAEGGHTAIDASLGTAADFDAFVADAASKGLEVALDYALQCSPDHPWVDEHPEWFHRRPDGSTKFAENPPKRYEDIYPLNFWPVQLDGPDAGTPDDTARRALWVSCKAILDHWIDRGIRIFRVDNPHTKPLALWEWMIPAVHAAHPDVIFLSEAFTRPKMMARLAEVGFTQSYTYFTWRNFKGELEAYVDELAAPQSADFFRPSFWTNTPDILAGVLRNGNEAAFKLRLVLAALLAPNWGMYSGYELLENEPASDENEEYLHSEKYEIKHRDWDDPRSIAPFVARVNDIRRRHPAFAELRTTRFHWVDNDALIVFSKVDQTGADPMLVVVNLDPHAPQDGTLGLDLGAIGLGGDGPIDAYDELTEQTFHWDGPNPWVRLDPGDQVAHVLSLRRA